MRNKLVNERNDSIKFRRDLMSLTYDIDSINCKNNKNHYGSFKDDLINTKNDSSYMIKNKDYIRKYKIIIKFTKRIFMLGQNII